MSQGTLPVLGEHVVRPRRDGEPGDPGVLLAPLDPVAVLQRIVSLLQERSDLRREWFVLLQSGSETRRAMAAQILFDPERPWLLDALTQPLTGPEARRLATALRDEAPGQCWTDRHCGLGEDHDGPCWVRGGDN